MARHQPLPAVAAALASLLPLGGCCNLALLWCGPDKSEWVEIDDRTPGRALATFLEAARRDRDDVIYLLLSQNLKAGLGNIGRMEQAIAWQLMQEQIPGVHLLARAERSEGVLLPDGRMRYRLAISGYHFELVFRRQEVVGLQYLGEDGPDDLKPLERWGALRQALILAADDLETNASLSIQGLAEGPQGLADRVVSVYAEHRWKLDGLRPFDPDAEAPESAP